MKTNKEVVALLEKLGDTADKVAASLTKLEIKGVRSKCKTCPIAVYLANEGAEAYVGMRSLFSTSTATDGFEFDFVFDEHPSLVGIQDFINRFDVGEYKQLDVNPVTAE